MNLVKFVGKSGEPVWVNPSFVVALDVAATDNGLTSITLSNGYVVVKGHADTTAAALMRTAEESASP